MFIIFRNVRVTLGKSRDLFRIIFILWKGLFAKREIGRAFFEKGL